MIKKIIFCAFLIFGQYFLSFAQLKVTFKTGKLQVPKVPDLHLYLAGDFNGWNPGDKNFELLPGSDGSYLLLKTLPKGIYNFKITRGSWQTAACSSSGKPIGNRSAVISHDTTIVIDAAGWQDSFVPQAKKHTAGTHVHLVSDKIDMPQLGRQRRIWIYLPSDYDTSRKKYPVIYMQDGQNLFDDYTSGYGEWGIDEIMDSLPPKDQRIIVGVDHGGDYRISEYDPYDSKYGKGQGNQYVDFLVKTLKPYIDQHYRTQKGASHTCIAGSSMGGLIAMYAVLKYPGVFGSAGVFSPAFWIAPDIYKYVNEKNLSSKSRFYFVCGDAESESMVSDMKKMTDLVRLKGISEKNSPALVIKGAQHNEKQWNGDFPGFYQWLLRNSQSR